MYKQHMFVMMAAILLTAVITIGLSAVSETAHAVVIIKKVGSNTTNATGGWSNMTNATTGGSNMTK